MIIMITVLQKLISNNNQVDNNEYNKAEAFWFDNIKLSRITKHDDINLINSKLTK